MTGSEDMAGQLRFSGVDEIPGQTTLWDQSATPTDRPPVRRPIADGDGGLADVARARWQQ